jgi:hypothetical protein
MKMRRQIRSVIALSVCCLSIAGCSEDLYKSRSVVPDQYSSAVADSEYTLLSLTPFEGEHADSLKKTGLINIQETTNYQQPLPAGIDVVYVNADYAPDKLTNSPLFWEALEKKTLLVDGSAANMEKFCKKNLPFYFPNAEMIAYQPNLKEEVEAGLTTIVFGPKDNPLSSGMLLASLWEYSPPNNTEEQPYPKFDTIPPTAIVPPPAIAGHISFNNGEQPLEIMATNSTSNVLETKGCVTNKCQDNVGGGGFDNAWWWIIENCDSRRQIRPDNYGCHYFNEGIKWDMTYSNRHDGPYGGADFSLFVRRQNCWDDQSFRGAKIPWRNEKFWRQDKPKTTVFAKHSNPELYAFVKNTEQQGYLDVAVINGQSRGWGVTHSNGVELGINLGVFKASISSSYSRGVDQSVTVTTQSQREFWVSACMYKISGGGKIYGKVSGRTLDRYVEGTSEMNIRIRYIEDHSRPSDKSPKTERYVEYCVREGAPASIIGSFKGDIKTSKYYWIAATWFNRNEEWIKSFKNCK